MAAPAYPERRRRPRILGLPPRDAGVAALLTLGAIPVVASCSVSASSGEVVGQALEAQLGGPGACAPISARDTASSRFFPGVRLVIGSCAHGGKESTALVGVDGAGVVFLLGSTPGFNFLITRHPPRGLDSTTVVAYAADALSMSGLLEPGARLIDSVGGLPEDIAAEMRRSGQAFSPTRLLEIRDDTWVVSLTTLSEHRVGNYWVSISRDTGLAHGSGKTLWRRDPD